MRLSCLLVVGLMATWVHAEGVAPPTGAVPATPSPMTIPGVPGAYLDPSPNRNTRRAQRERSSSDETKVNISALRINRTGGNTFEAEGRVVVKFDDVEIRGESLKADLSDGKGTALLPGRVEILFQDQRLVGDDLTLFMDERRWKFARGNGTFEPSFFTPGAVQQSVLAQGSQFAGDDNRVDGKRSRLTACDYPAPHYNMSARELIIIPDQRAVLKKVRIYYKDTVLAALPVYVIDLRPNAVARRRQSLIPIFGENDIEGKFLKLSLGLYAGAAMAGTGYLDLYEKRGTGLGLQHDYTYAQRGGSIYTYYLSDKTNGTTQFDTRLRHTERFSNSLSGTFSLDATRNNQFQGAGSGILNLDANLTRQVGTANSALHVRRESFDSAFSASASTTASLRHTQNLGQRRSLSLNTDYRRTSSSGGFNLNELNTKVEYTERQKLLDLLLRTELREDLDRNARQGATFINALDRAPEVVLRTDSTKFNRQLFGKMPMLGSLSLGAFREFPQNASHERVHFEFQAQDTMFPLVARRDQPNQPKLSLDLGGGFHQSFYSSAFARYQWNERVRLSARPSGSVNFALDYGKQKPIGFTPFRFDFVNEYESVDATLSFDIGKRKPGTTSTAPNSFAAQQQQYNPGYGSSYSQYGGFQQLNPDSGTKLRLNFSSGYDVGFSQYRDLIMRMQYLPSRSLYLSASTGYDPNLSNFRDVVARMTLAPRSAFRFNTSLRYDPNSGRVTRVNSFARVPFLRWWQLEALNGYNGFTRKSDFTQFRLRRELHDAHLYFSYDHQRREFRMDFALKAFPAFDSRFGVGTQGQPLYGVGPGGELLGAGVGEIY